MCEIIGIDFGAANSCVAVFEEGTPKIVSDGTGRSAIPSVVSVLEESKIFVGETALAQSVENPENTVFNIKGLLGKEFDSTEVRNRKKSTFCSIENDGHNGVCVRLGGKTYKPEKIASFILADLKKIR